MVQACPDRRPISIVRVWSTYPSACRSNPARSAENRAPAGARVNSAILRYGISTKGSSAPGAASNFENVLGLF